MRYKHTMDDTLRHEEAGPPACNVHGDVEGMRKDAERLIPGSEAISHSPSLDASGKLREP